MRLQDKYQVIVTGGGPSGIMAALASARAGAQTLLIERSAFLGGTATLSRIGPISPFQYKDEQVVRGLPQEFIDAMVRAGGATGHMKCLNPYGTGSYVCIYNHEIYKYVAQKMLTDAGVKILFHTTVSGVLKKGNRLTGVVLSSKFGTSVLSAEIFVDATGDGDLAYLAGEGYEYGDGLGNVQPSSAMFEMANVDTEKLYDYILRNPGEFGRLSDLVPFVESPFQDQIYFVAQGYQSLVDEAVRRGELVFGRENVHTTTGLYPGVMHFNTARISNYNTVNLVARSESELDGRRQIESIANFMVRRVPGYEHAYISSTEDEVGVRESRHIHGVYRLTGEDILNNRKFDDVIARGLFAIDIHGKRAAPGTETPKIAGAGGLWMDLKDAYDIPYRALVPKTVDGLLLAGRCISADTMAFSSARVQGTLMGYSQASGLAAALCVRYGVQPRALAPGILQEALIQMGASPYRDEKQKAQEEAYADEQVRRFLSRRKHLITPEVFLAPYRQQKAI